MTTLSAREWNEVFSLPADGVSYNIAGVCFRAAHYPATSMKCEQVIASTRFGTLRRIFSRGKWQATEYVTADL